MFQSVVSDRIEAKALRGQAVPVAAEVEIEDAVPTCESVSEVVTSQKFRLKNNSRKSSLATNPSLVCRVEHVAWV